MPQPSVTPEVRPRIFRFGPYEVDFSIGELRKSGMHIKVQDQPLQILEMLLERPGELVTREQLRERLWAADTFVDFDHSLNSAIKKLRHALGDDAETPRFVETLARRGYRFIVPVTSADAMPIQTAPQAVRVAPDGRRARIVVALTLAVVVGIIGVVLLPFWRRGVSPPQIESIAVLPLQNLSRDPEQEYFADGLTDALITDLGKLATLRVISHTSVMRYKGTTKPLGAIARELNVDSLVEGTILRSGNRVRITTQLLRAEPEEHLWAESYERDLADVLRLQAEVSRNIAVHIESKINRGLASGNGAQLVNSQAYDSYLRGRFYFDKRVASAVRQAIGYFEQAINEDPKYAPAYSGLADCYTVTWSSELVDRAKGEAYARKAIALQDDLAEAHASLGVARLYDFDFREAEKELKRAIELNPNYSMAHHWFALHFLALGRMDEALRENDTARQLNPFSVPVNNARIMILVGLRRYDDALEQAETLREIEDNYASHLAKARVYRLKNRYSEAMAEEQKLAEILGDKQRQSDFDRVARRFAAEGYPSAVKAWAELKARHYRHPYSAAEIAVAEVQAGNHNHALKWLQQANEDRDFNSYPLKTAPEFDPIRSDARFQKIISDLELGG